MYKRIKNCRLCGSSDLKIVLDLGMQALTGVFPHKLEEAPPLGPLCLAKCNESSGGCGLAQLMDSFEPTAMYGDNYGYRSGLNASMVAHLQGKAARIKAKLGLPRKLAVDIGSNDGTFLNAIASPGVDLVGMDPTGRKFSRYYPPDARLIPEFFSAETFRTAFGERKADLVTSFAMFYDLEAPLEFAAQIASILDENGIWVLEQSYLPLMIERNSYDTICHEHLEYYALAQIRYIAEKVGLKIVDIELNDVNGGSFSVSVAHRDSAVPVCETAIQDLLESERSHGITDGSAWCAFHKSFDAERDALLSFLREQKAAGHRVFGFGASTKGNVLLQYCGIGPELMSAIAEVNPDKFGAYTPGTWIPIVSQEEAYRADPDVFVVLPWHFRNSIVRREQAFLQRGGTIVFPLPHFEIVRS